MNIFGRNRDVLALLLTTLVHIAPGAREDRRDDTIVFNAKGQDVVESVLRKISNSNIFPHDHSFLVRVAYVESTFGENHNTFRRGYNGGIWQVDEDVFLYTRSSVDKHVSVYHEEIEEKFGISWVETTWDELRKPLYSGIAAAIYFTSLNETIPDIVSGQAGLWKTHYRESGNVTRFLDASHELTNKTKCRGKMDLCIVLDSSGSIQEHNFVKTLNFTAALISSFTLDYTRIGMLVYSSYTQDIFEIHNNLTIQKMADAAKKARYIALGTRTDFGITRAVTMFQEAKGKESVPKVMIVLTDGKSEVPTATLEAVRKSQAEGIKSISIGIGDYILDSELMAIALNDSRSVFKLTDFSALQGFLYTITQVACNMPQKPLINGIYQDKLVKGERRRYEIGLPPGGITVRVTVPVGNTKGFWSKTECVPSEAVHDGKIYGGATYIPGGGNKTMNLPDGEVNNTARVYVTIQGVQDSNSYSLRYQRGDTTNGASLGRGGWINRWGNFVGGAVAWVIMMSCMGWGGCVFL